MRKELKRRRRGVNSEMKGFCIKNFEPYRYAPANHLSATTLISINMQILGEDTVGEKM